MKKIILVLIGSFSGSMIFAGSSQVQLECRSDSGLTEVVAELPGDDSYTYSFTLTIRKGSASYPISYSRSFDFTNNIDRKDGTVTVVDGIENGDNVYTIVAEKESDVLEKKNVLYAIPESVEIRRPNSYTRKATFRAKLTGINPRKLQNPDNEEEREYPYNSGENAIELNCTYDYSI